MVRLLVSGFKLFGYVFVHLAVRGSCRVLRLFFIDDKRVCFGRSFGLPRGLLRLMSLSKGRISGCQTHLKGETMFISKKVAWWGGSVAVLIAVISLILRHERLLLTRATTYIQGQAWWGLPWTVAIVTISLTIAAFIGWWDNRHPSFYSRDVDTKKLAKRLFRLAWVMVPISLAALTWAVFASASHGYLVDRAYASHVVETDTPNPEFGQRAAFTVARDQIQSTAGDIHGTFVDDTTYMPQENVYTTLMERPGMHGYIALEVENVQLTGQAHSTMCKFSDQADRKIGGWWSHNIWRAIVSQKANVFFTAEDAYGYCDNNTPMVVIPLLQWKGLFPAVAVPAGVAVYNGSTGETKVYDKSPKDLPGPVFPISVAAKMREATAALGGYWDWQKSRVGYTTADGEGTAETNISEFALMNKDSNSPVYATPLTSRLQSQSIVALGVVEAGTANAGEIPTYTIYKLPEPRLSNGSVNDRLRSDYSQDVGWASGLKVFEIAPLNAGDWVASIGMSKNVAFRVLVKADGSSCLERADGTKLRCADGSPTPGGATTSVVIPGSSEELAKLSDADLSNLLDQLTNEVKRRLSAK